MFLVAGAWVNATLGRDTAAGAEESAAAAQELWAQSESLTMASRELVDFFDGTTTAAPRGRVMPLPKPSAASTTRAA